MSRLYFFPVCAAVVFFFVFTFGSDGFFFCIFALACLLLLLPLPWLLMRHHGTAADNCGAIWGDSRCVSFPLMRAFFRFCGALFWCMAWRRQPTDLNQGDGERQAPQKASLAVIDESFFACVCVRCCALFSFNLVVPFYPKILWILNSITTENAKRGGEKRFHWHRRIHQVMADEYTAVGSRTKETRK